MAHRVVLEVAPDERGGASIGIDVVASMLDQKRMHTVTAGERRERTD